eukprot:jgi/Undpi1/4478/HiC_scaffold_17.g07832.m1
MLGWIVWILAVTASVDDHWFLGVGFFSAGNEVLLDRCEDDLLADGFCHLYVSFTALQFLALAVASMSMTFLIIALLRPASAQFCSSYAIAIAAGTLMAMYALFQMLASVLVVIIQRSEKEFGGYEGFFEDLGLGATFSVAAAGVFFGMLQAGVVLVFAQGAGDGPLYKYLRNCSGRNTRSLPVSGSSPPQPPRPVATAPVWEATPASQIHIPSPHVEPPMPKPGFDVQLGTQPVPSPVARSAAVPELRSRAVQSPVSSPAAEREAENAAVSSPTPNNAVEPAHVAAEMARSPVANSSNASSAVNVELSSRSEESPAASPAIQPTEAVPAIQHTIEGPAQASPAIQSEAESPNVQLAISSPAVELPLASPGAEPAGPSPSVPSSVASTAIHPAAENPAV